MKDTTTGCPKCSYTGFRYVEGDDSRVQQCLCSYAKTLKAYLGPEIASAPTITTSPLYQLGGKGEPPKVDRTSENLFLKTYWSDLLPHLKWTLACKGPMFRYRVVTDEKLKTVYVGNEAYSQRAKDVRNEVTTFNSLGDLVGPEIDLIIIRLGFLGHKNVAMPGVLKESLMLREAAMKPTWVVEVPSSPFVPGHFSYSEDTWDYVSRLFEFLEIKGVKRPEVPHGFDDFEEEEDEVGLGARTPSPEPVARPPRPVPVAPPAPPPPTPIELRAVTDDPKPKFKKSGGGGSFGKKRSSGGPGGFE